MDDYFKVFRRIHPFSNSMLREKLGKETTATVRPVSYMAHKHAYALSLVRLQKGASRMHDSMIIMRHYG